MARISSKIPEKPALLETRTVKIWLSSYRRAKIMAAKRGVTFVALIEELTKEAERLDKLARDGS